MNLRPIEPPHNWTSLEIHELSMAFPPAGRDVMTDIDKSMEDWGFRADEPIVLFEGKILDGRNRWNSVARHNLCKQPKIVPSFAEFVGVYDEAINYVISKNLHRRHMDATTKVLSIRALLGLWSRRRGRPAQEPDKKMGHVGPFSGLPAQEPDKKMGHVGPFSGLTGSVSEVASIATVGERSVKRADSVARIIGPKRVQAIIEGKTTPYKALKDAERERADKGAPTPRDELPRADEPEGAAIGRQLLRDLQRLRRDVAAFCAGQWGREVHVQTVTTDLDNAIRAIKFGIPYAKCPLQPDEGCTLCAGSGWVSRAKWAGVPDELKRTNGAHE